MFKLCNSCDGAYAAILDMRVTRNASLVDKYVSVYKDGVVETGTCICGFCGNYKVVKSTLDTGRLWVQYKCPNCDRFGELAWLE